jgi:hypothetical protein
MGDETDNGLLAVLQVLWQHPRLMGAYRHQDREPATQARIVPDKQHITSGLHLYGFASIDADKRVACGTVAVREPGGTIWLSLYIPVGALDAVYDVGGFPFDDGDHRAWRQPLERWFAGIGSSIFRQHPFRLGLIGHEVSASDTAADITAQGIPIRRRIGYLRPEADRLVYHPTTLW